MCGRYYIAEEDSAAELQEIIEQLNRRGAEVKTGEIYPTDTVPVLANNKSMVIAPFAMKWGYTLPDGKQIINARSETAADKPLFR
ncbi:MAG: SOS response-associated peptidase, partial [Candidatus Aphodomonas sp.]|nr:SOS response-associated peptidase [Candidatus Aphodomonas sp.]